MVICKIGDKTEQSSRRRGHQARMCPATNLVKTPLSTSLAAKTSPIFTAFHALIERLRQNVSTL
jgi:hypothetical protein